MLRGNGDQTERTSLLIITSVRWFYKDVQTAPIEMGDSGEVIGEYLLEYYSSLYSPYSY